MVENDIQYVEFDENDAKISCQKLCEMFADVLKALAEMEEDL